MDDTAREVQSSVNFYRLPYGITKYRQVCLDSFNVCLLSIYYILVILCTKNRAVTKKGKNHCPFEAYILLMKQTKSIQPFNFL